MRIPVILYFVVELRVTVRDDCRGMELFQNGNSVPTNKVNCVAFPEES